MTDQGRLDRVAAAIWEVHEAKIFASAPYLRRGSREMGHGNPEWMAVLALAEAAITADDAWLRAVAPEPRAFCAD